MKTRKKALVIALVIALVPILVLTVSADAVTLNINNYSYVDVSSVNVETQPSQYNFQFINGYMDKAWPTDVFNLDTTMFRFRFVAQDIGAAEYPNLMRFFPSATFNLPIPSGYYDETSIIFTIATGLYTNQDQQLLTNIIDDVSIYVNNTHTVPIATSINTKGCYWTFEVDISDFGSENSLTVLPLFQDFDVAADPSYGNFPGDVWWMVQFSPIIFTASKSASAQYAAAIEQLIENELSPTLSNIEGLMDTMNGQQAALNSQVSDLKESVDELPGEIGEEFDTALENQGAAEHSYGLQQGDKNVQDALGALPMDNINQAGSAIERLANAISTDQRSSRFDIPEIYIPQLKSASGEVLMEKLTLIEPTSFYWEDVIDEFVPPTLLIVVRAVITLGLGMYIFFELFRFIGMFSSPGGEG